MTTKDHVRAAMTKHPNWYAEDIADILNCTPEYVRATARRYQWSFKSRQHIPHIRIPLEWIEKARAKGETQRQTLDRVFGLK